MAGPEVPFPLTEIVRYTDRVFRLPAEQRAGVVARAKERLKRKGHHGKRDQFVAKLTGTVVGNG